MTEAFGSFQTPTKHVFNWLSLNIPQQQNVFYKILNEFLKKTVLNLFATNLHNNIDYIT